MTHGWIGSGHLLHTRHSPVRHAFRYAVGMRLFDVSGQSVAAVDREDGTGVRGRFRRYAARMVPRVDTQAVLMDYEGETVVQRVNAALASVGKDPHAGPFLVLAQPRTLMSGFNPVRFVFCMNAGAIVHVLAEINNTPWNERHTYVLSAQSQANEVTFEFAKAFHVSPFNAMAQTYRWWFGLHAGHVRIRMRVSEGSRRVFSAVLLLRLEAATPTTGLRFRLRYPLQPLVNLARIYVQALRLWLRGTRFHSHPGATSAATTGAPPETSK